MKNNIQNNIHEIFHTINFLFLVRRSIPALKTVEVISWE